MADQDTAHLVTQLLASILNGDEAGRQRLWELVYQELRGMACAQIAREPAGRTLQPTALVHEAYLKLFGGADSITAKGGRATFENRRHFFAAAARAMQQIRVDDARRRGRLKRGGDHGFQPLGVGDDGPRVFDQDPAEVLAVGEAMEQLESRQPQLAEVVRLRYFAGLTVEEVAEALSVTPRTVANRWRIAKAMLSRALSGE